MLVMAACFSYMTVAEGDWLVERRSLPCFRNRPITPRPVAGTSSQALHCTSTIALYSTVTPMLSYSGQLLSTGVNGRDAAATTA